MKLIFNYLYFKKIPEANHGIFPKEALDLMQDSEMQRILGQDYEEQATFNNLITTLD
jgi:hypothetical protein